MAQTDHRQVPHAAGRSAERPARNALVTLASGRLAEVVLEPGQDAAVVVLAVLGRAAAQEEVRAARVARELHLAAGLLQRDEHLLPLPDRAALVRLAVDNQGRRLRSVRVVRRRVLVVPGAVLVRRGAELDAAEGVADVA